MSQFKDSAVNIKLFGKTIPLPSKQELASLNGQTSASASFCDSSPDHKIRLSSSSSSSSSSNIATSPKHQFAGNLEKYRLAAKSFEV
ncbi:hypothetical protein CsatA_015127 [Cannabis sativa]